MSPPPRLPRRLALAAPFGLAAATGRAGAAPADAAACVLTPQSIEGPFYLDPRLVRSAIAEDRPGVKLRLALHVVEAATCRPVAGARVDIWHADAQGLYSDYPGQGDGRDTDTRGQHFLRGTQIAGAAGAVGFETIWPGWYAGRATHVHVKVFLDERNVAMGQIYFPDALNEYLYANLPAYGGRRGTRDVVNSNDGIARADDPERIGFCAVAEARDGYLASLTLGIDRQAVARSNQPPPGRPPGAGRPPGGPGGRAPRIAPVTDRPRALIPGLPD